MNLEDHLREQHDTDYFLEDETVTEANQEKLEAMHIKYHTSTGRSERGWQTTNTHSH